MSGSPRVPRLAIGRRSEHTDCLWGKTWRIEGWRVMCGSRRGWLVRICLAGGLATACALTALTALTGCGAPAKALPMTPLAETRPADAKAAWRRVLKDHVKQGCVHYFGLAEDPAGLQWYATWLASHGPDSTPGEFPTPADRLAYWLNARGASAIRAGLAHHRARRKMPWKKRDDADPRPPFARVTFRVDGKEMTLGEMASRAWSLRPGDVRVAAALFDGSASGPPAPATPYAPDALGERLQARWNELLCDRDLTRIDHQRRTLFVLPDVYNRREQLVADCRKKVDIPAANPHTALLGLADAKGRAWLHRALGYRIAPLPVSHGIRQFVQPWDDGP